MPDYVKNLPKPVQDLIFDGEWEKRTKEVCIKYSLSDGQSEGLINTILFILIGLDKPEVLMDFLEKNLQLSNIKSEQILDELEGRVFDYAYKKVTSNNILEGNIDLLPEIKPNNLPVIENQTPQNKNLSSTPVPSYNYTPRPKVIIDEPVQAPITVPRFKAVPLEDGEVAGKDFIPTLAPKPNAGGIMETKLNSVTKSVSSTQTPSDVPKKYTSDPYREPLS